MSRLSRDALFRPEATTAAQSKFGAPINPASTASWAITLLMLLVASSLIGLLFTAKYARRETVFGTLIPDGGAQQVTALRSGIIAEVFADEGRVMRPGDALLRISYDTTDSSGDSIGRLLDDTTQVQALSVAGQGQARIGAIDAQINAALSRIAGLRRQMSRAQANRTLQVERARLASETVEATRKLFDRQLIAAVQMRQREDNLISVQQQLSAIEGEMDSLVTEIAQVTSEVAQLRSDRDHQISASALASAQVAEKRIELAGQNGEVITSRIYGLVSSSMARPGKTVQPGDTLLVVMPEDSALEAELWIPSRAAGFLELGQTVRIMYDAFPYQRFGTGHGKIRHISRSPTMPNDLPTPVETKEPLYRVTVSLDAQNISAYGRSWRPSPGMQLKADIVLDERPLIAWVLEPLNALRKRA